MTGLFLSSFACSMLNGQTLTENGLSKAEILVDCTNQKNCPIEFGAKELQMWLEKISGAKLEIKSAPGDSVTRIYIGTPQLSAKIKEVSTRYSNDLKKIGNTDGFSIRINGNDIYIFGKTPKGALNGVFQFLNDNTDLIFVRPLEAETGLGTIYSQNKTLAVKGKELVKVPAFPSYRYFTSNTPEGHLWQTRLMNLPNITKRNIKKKDAPLYQQWGLNLIGGAHSFNNIMPIKQLTKSNPEIYPEIKNARKWNLNFDTFLCWTNPESFDIFMEYFMKEVDECVAQGINLIELPHGDTDQVCMCENCTQDIVVDGKVVSRYADVAGKNPDIPPHMANHQSTLYYLFMNKVAKAVKAKYPQVRLRGMAYWVTRIAPAIPLESNIDIFWAPYKKTLRLPMTNPRLKTDRYNYPDTFDAWKKVVNGNFQLYEYQLCTQPALAPNPVADVIAEDLKFYLDKKMNGVYFDSNGWDSDTQRFTDSGRQWLRSNTYDSSAIEHWVISRLMWDPSQDPEKLRDEFCRRAFGKAAPEMRAFYRLYHDGWDINQTFLAWNNGATHCFENYICYFGRGPEAEKLLNQALEKAENPGSKALIKRQLEVFRNAGGNQ